VYTLQLANLILLIVYFTAIPQHGDMVLARCTNTVASPFGVTGALTTVLSLLKMLLFILLYLLER